MSHLSTLINRAHARLQVNQSNHDQLQEDSLFRQAIRNLIEYPRLWNDFSDDELSVAEHLISKYKGILTPEDLEGLEEIPELLKPVEITTDLHALVMEIVARLQLAELKPEKMIKDHCLRECFDALEKTIHSDENLYTEEKRVAEKLYERFYRVYYPEKATKPAVREFKHAIKNLNTATDDDIKALVNEVAQVLENEVEVVVLLRQFCKISTSGDSLRAILACAPHLGYKYGLDLLLGIGRYMRHYPRPHVDWNQFRTEHINILKEIADRVRQAKNINGANINGYSQN